MKKRTLCVFVSFGAGKFYDLKCDIFVPALFFTDSKVGNCSGSSGGQCVPAATPGANSWWQKGRCSLKDHTNSNNKHQSLIGSNTVIKTKVLLNP